jgi:cytosine/adenosine deaminase-related metal-dependent hydrolase
LLAENRQALLLGRVRAGLMGASLSGDSAPPLLTARQVLEIGTLGGANVLGRTDIGSLESGKCADIIGFNLNTLDYSGALHDPVAAILFCNPRPVDLNMVHGKMIVRDGQLLTIDLEKQVRDHNKAADRLLEKN